MPPNWSVSFREKPQSLSLTQAPTSSLPSPTTHSPSPSSPTGLFALLGHTKLRAFFAHARSSPSFLFPQIIRMASLPTIFAHLLLVALKPFREGKAGNREGGHFSVGVWLSFCFKYLWFSKYTDKGIGLILMLIV